MSPERTSVSAEVREETFGSLNSCLVEGNPERQNGERRLRRRSLILSVLTQSVVLTLLVLAPLFGRTESLDPNLTICKLAPLPPFGHHVQQARGHQKTSDGRQRTIEKKFIFNPPTPNVPIQTHDDSDAGDQLVDENAKSNLPNGPDCSWCINIGTEQPGPPPPQTVETQAKPHTVRVAQIDPGMLIYRVEPRYPALAMQTHREGRVELRAIISAEGSIELLQIVVSDPLFNQSALEAVQQWRYRPTILNGQPVRVDTYITVFYKIPH